MTTFSQMILAGISSDEEYIQTFFTVSSIDVTITKGGVQVMGIPVNIPDSIYSLVKTGEERYKNFWFWLSMNPNENARTHLYNWLEKNQIKIHSSGYLIIHRAMLEPVQANWYKLKSTYDRLKKSKKKTSIPVYRNEDEFTIDPQEKGVPIANLNELFTTECFTDNYTRSEVYFLGKEVRMPRSQGDESEEQCSSGYHLAGDNYNTSGFGKVLMACAVNPKDILACVEGSSKMRTCAFIPIKHILQPKDRHFITDAEVDAAVSVGFENIQQALDSHEWKEDGQHWAVDLGIKKLTEFKQLVTNEAV